MAGKDRTRKPSRQEAAGRVLGAFTQDPQGEGGLSSIGQLMKLLGMGSDLTSAAGGPQWLPEEYRNAGTRYLEPDDADGKKGAQSGGTQSGGFEEILSTLI